MEITKYVWSLYAKSKEGKSLIKQYTSFPRDFIEKEFREYPTEIIFMLSTSLLTDPLFQLNFTEQNGKLYR